MRMFCDKCQKGVTELHSTHSHDFWYCQKCFALLFPEIDANVKEMENEKEKT